MRICGYIAGAVLALLLVSLPAAAITGAEIVEKVRENFSRYKSFSAQFEKQFYWAVLGKKRSRRGKIYTRRPAQFRLEIAGGDLVVADGKAIWAYARQSGQVVVSSYRGELKTPWEILLDYTQSFVPIAVEEVELEGRSCYLINFEPRTPGAGGVAHMKIWVGKKDWQLLKVEQMENNDNLTTYILKDHRINKKLDEALFHFVPPEGIEVIDRRDAGAKGEG